MTENDPWAGETEENQGENPPQGPRNYSRMNKEQLQTELRSRGVEFDEDATNSELATALQQSDADRFGSGVVRDEGSVDSDVNFAALPPDSPMKTGHYVQSNQGEPQIRVRTPEGEELDVDASQEKDLREVGFEVVAGSDELGPNGTRTTAADPAWVEFSNAERAQAERILNLNH